MIKQFARLVVSLILLGFLLWKMDLSVLGHYFINVNPLMFIAAIFLILCAIGIRAYRWTTMMTAYNIKLSFRKSFGLIQVGNFFGQFLPMTVGGDMVRTWQAHRDGLPLKASIHTVLLDRLFGFVSLLVIILVGIPALPQIVPKPQAIWLLAGTVSLALAGLLSTLFLDRLTRRFHQGRVLREISEFSVCARRLVANVSLSLPVFIACIATHLLSITAIKVLADGVGANVGLYQMLLLMPPVILMAMLPFSLAGWGVREGAMVFALGYIGISAEQSFAISILMGLLSLLVSLPGGLVMLYAPTGPINEKI
jgi:uncharacterized protein (TIRG00374 family)